MLPNFASKPLAVDDEFRALQHHHSIGCSESEDEILNNGNVSFHCMSEEEISMFPPPAGKYLLRSPTSSTASCASAASFTPEEEGMEQTLEETALALAGDDEKGPNHALTEEEEEEEPEEQIAQSGPDLVDHLRFLVDTDPFFGDLILTASEVADEYNNSIAGQLSPVNQPRTANRSFSNNMTMPKKKNRLLSVGKKMKRLPKSLFRR